LTRAEREAAALTVVCPLCRAGVGQRCLKQTATNNYWDRHPTKHPHAVRIEKATHREER
jgi:hypothetical protein